MQTGMTYRDGDGAAHVIPVVSVHHTVRSAAIGYFLKVLGIFKPLAGFKVSEMSLETEIVVVEHDEPPEHTYTLRASLAILAPTPATLPGRAALCSSCGTSRRASPTAARI
eukprot:1049392-Pleurochrysis_carterae.AAC.1